MKYKVGSECELYSWTDTSVGYSVWTEFSSRGLKSYPGQLYYIYILKLNVFNFQQCYCLHIPVTRFALGRAHQCYLFMNSKHHKSDFFQVAIQLFLVTTREIYKRTKAVFQLSYRQPLWILLCANNSAVES